MAQQKLLRKVELDLFKKHGCQDGKGGDALVIARLFHPISSYTWYVTEYDSETGYLFGFVVGHEMEWGTIASLHEMSNMVVHGLEVERDAWFTPKPLREALKDDRRVYPYD